MKDKIKAFLWFLLNPRFIICFLIAWMITNGWSYILLAIGTLLSIPVFTAIAGAYLAFLWLPISPEKIVTFAISIFLLKKLFPNDQKTLAVIERLYRKAKDVFKKDLSKLKAFFKSKEK